MTSAPLLLLCCFALPLAANPQEVAAPLPATPGRQASAPLVVRVLDGATGAPCPEATVFAIDARHPSRQVAADPFEPVFARLARCGRSFRTDANGNVTLPTDLDVVELGATGERGVALAHITQPTVSPFVLTLQPDRKVSVRIVDAAGKPANLTATAWRLHPGGQGASGAVGLRPDAAGLATLQPMTLFTSSHELPLSMRSGRLDQGGTVEIRLDLVAPTVPTHLLEERGLPPSITLVAPAIGELEVTVLDDDGKPMTSGHVHAQALGNDPSKGHGKFVEIVAGKARIPAVAVGIKVRLAANCFLRHGPVLEVDGPTRAGEVVSATLRGLLPRGDGRPVMTLRGRLHGPDGKALAKCALRIGVLRETRLLAEYEPFTTTDGDGTFHCEMLGPLSADDELVLAAAIAPHAEVDHVALVAAKAATMLELGDVRVAKAPLLCDVRTVDERGATTNQWFSVTDHKGNPPMTLPGSTVHPDRTGRVRVWSPIDRKETLTAVTIQGQDQTQVRHFAAGSTVTLPMPSLQCVPGRVLLANAHAAEHLTVRLTPSSEYGKIGCGLGFARPFSMPIAADGSFVAGPVQAGKWHLQVLLADAFEVALVENVVVTADGRVDDPRLRELDLKQALREITVHVDRGNHDPHLAGDISLSVVGTPTHPKILLTNARAEFRQLPVRLFVPAQGDFELHATLAGRDSPKVAARDAVVRLRFE